jgi:hypothetical protein
VKEHNCVQGRDRQVVPGSCRLTALSCSEEHVSIPWLSEVRRFCSPIADGSVVVDLKMISSTGSFTVD